MTRRHAPFASLHNSLRKNRTCLLPFPTNRRFQLRPPMQISYSYHAYSTTQSCTMHVMLCSNGRPQLRAETQKTMSSRCKLRVAISPMRWSFTAYNWLPIPQMHQGYAFHSLQSLESLHFHCLHVEAFVAYKDSGYRLQPR